MRVLFSLALLAGSLLAGGNPPAPTHSRPPQRPATSAPAQSDAVIEAAIKAKFAKSKINADHFAVKVQGGVATITGKTEVIQRKGTATRLAKLAGARAVNNEIELSEAAREKAADNLERGRRRAQVKRSEVPGR